MTSQGCATPPGICQIGPIQSGGTATTSQDMSYTFTDASGHNNGNVVTIANNLDMDRTQSFTYDSLNRLSSAWTTGTNQPAFNGDTDYLQECWSENYSYDPWGNLLKLGPGSSSSYTGCTQESGFDFSSSGSIGANNRIAVSGYVYDAAGNLITSPGAGTVTFNAENQMVSAGGVNYLYDGDGKRVSKSNGTLYWYGTGSDPLLETTNAGAAFNSYIYFDGKRVGKSTTLGPGGISWFMTDHLGTSRVVSSTAGSDVSDFYPFGGERVVQATSGVSNHYKFTGKERDSESGLDNFGARFDSSTLGRFTSPDPLLNSGRPWNPQTWNRYSYTLNNPLNIVDPTGLYDLVNNCASDDKKCNKQFRQHADDLKKGLADLQKKVDKMKDGPEKQRLQASLTVLGTEGDHNGVNAKFGALSGSTAAQTDYNTATNGQLSATITFDPSKNISSTEYGINAAHEGTHIEDSLTGLVDALAHADLPGLGSFSLSRLPQLSPFPTEYRGYQTSAWAAQAFGQPSLSFRGIQIWNSSWAAADRQTLQDRAITNVVVDKDHPETTPHNPWPN